MPTMRIIKDNNFTTMSNYHLQKDKSLSLKAKGLLSLMLSLPDEIWSFSIRGLASMCGDKEDSVSAGLKELEKGGYLIRMRERNHLGQLGKAVYYVYELPQLKEGGKTGDAKNVEIASFQPKPDFPVLGNPVLDNRTLEPNQELSELNINILNTKGDGLSEGRIAREEKTDFSTPSDQTVLIDPVEPDTNPEELIEQKEAKENPTALMREAISGAGQLNLSREEVHEAVKLLTGQSYQDPEPAESEEVRDRYQKTGLLDLSTKYFTELACCGLEDLFCAALKDGIQIGAQQIPKKRLLKLLQAVNEKPMGYVNLVYLCAARLIMAFKKGQINSPRRYSRAVLVDILKAGEAKWEAELAMLERPWLGQKSPPDA